jgi:acetyl/propionyl-CoA carboxylase alpha subunit
VHPGYGFLSENEDFAQACADAGLVFIGPPPSAIAAMGSKSAAKALMERAGVPLVPGYHGDDNDPALLAREADRIGYPVLIKASAGGGGKGMRRVEKAEDFAAALASCQREAKASVRRRPRAGRTLRHAAAPHRDPGLRRQPWPGHPPGRARLLGAAPPPEGAGRSPPRRA